MKSNRVTLPGSERQPVGTHVSAQAGDEQIEISVILKPKERVPAPQPGAQPISREEFAARYGASPEAVEKVREFAREHNLRVAEVSLERRTIKLEGAASDMIRAFDVKLARYEYQGHQYRARTGGIQVPSDVAESVEAILGLDDRPQARAHFCVKSAKSASAVSYSPRQVAELYQFPLTVTGAGETVGILEFGGGFRTTDLKNYFTSLGLPEPNVIAVLVDKAKNKPSNANSADGEVMLDIEVIGSVAPGAKIVVYFAPNTTQGFQDALTTAVHDATNKPSVISISWGGPESTWTAQAMTAFDSAAADGGVMGVTVCAASGDSGSSDGVTDGKNHVDFPASGTHILGCGGTSLQSSGDEITSETVWNDSSGASGGGYSTQFPLPSWQSAIGIKPPSGLGRGVPDVAGDADPETGYNVLVDGDSLVIGGTSAVAPLWSGLFALLNEALGKPVGFVGPTLYGLPASADAFHDIVSGSNGAYSAGPGWDPTTGLGSPDGENLLEALEE